jgi:predicted Ser/Thr protein kinase
MDTTVRSRLQQELKGSQLHVTRGLWIAFALIAFVIYAVALPPYFALLSTICDGANCFPLQLTTPIAQAFNLVGLSPQFYASYFIGANLFNQIAYLLVGLILFMRSRRLLVLLIAFALVQYTLLRTYAVESLSLNLLPPVANFVDLLQGLALWISLTTWYVFPNGRFIPRWTKPFCIFWGVWLVGLAPFFPALMVDQWSPPIYLLMNVVWLVTLVYAQSIRYRQFSSRIERLQTRWAVYGISLTAFGFIVYYSMIVLLSAIPGAELPLVLLWLLLTPVYALLLMSVPITVAFAILRYRLFDLNLLINRSLVYTLMTVLLGVLFAATLLAVQALIRALTNGEQPGIALVVAAVLLGVAFTPVRARIGRFVDKRIFKLRTPIDQIARPRPQPKIKERGALTGMQVREYDILDAIGKGGMGEVYKGWHRERGVAVAVKVLSDDFAKRDNALVRFQREADAIRQLDHPHIVHFYDFFKEGGRYFMMLEYVEGHSLETYWKSNELLSVEDAHKIVRQVAEALDYAHSRDVVHRDVKPSNILLRMVDGVPHAMLIDFGVAKLETLKNLTNTDTTLGTVGYMAPEQIIASREVTKAADIYSLGVTLYEILTGHLPFEQGSVASIIFAHLQKPAPDIRDMRPDVSPKIAQSIQRAMGKEPEDRFESAGEFVDAIGEVVKTI